MRKLGLIGGMSWVSTRTYYEHINRLVQQKGDRYASAPLLIESLDFAQLHALRESQDWERAAGILARAESWLTDHAAALRVWLSLGIGAALIVDALLRLFA